MKISTVNEETGNTVVRISGDLVANNVDPVTNTIKNLGIAAKTRVFLDLAEVSFMDSTGLKACMHLQNYLRDRDSELVCFNLNANIQKLFKVTGADQKILVVESTTTRPEITTVNSRRKNHLLLKMAPVFAEVDLARKAVDEVCREFYVNERLDEAIGDFVLATTEAMNNVVEHSRARRMSLELIVQRDRMISILRNDGQGFDPTREVTMPDLDGELAEGGFGRAIINDLMDEVQYDFIDEQNVLTLIKNID
jgi:anti-anti-sigma factor